MKQNNIFLVAVIGFILSLLILISSLASVMVMDARTKEQTQKSSLEITYIQETGNYPDWFLEWLNTEYLPGHMED